MAIVPSIWPMLEAAVRFNPPCSRCERQPGEATGQVRSDDRGHGKPRNRTRPILLEVMIERERTRHAPRGEHGERDGVAQRPVLVDVSRENLFGALLLRGLHGDDGKAAREQPLTRHVRPSFLSRRACAAASM